MFSLLRTLVNTRVISRWTRAVEIPTHVPCDGSIFSVLRRLITVLGSEFNGSYRDLNASVGLNSHSGVFFAHYFKTWRSQNGSY